MRTTSSPARSTSRRRHAFRVRDVPAMGRRIAAARGPRGRHGCSLRAGSTYWLFGGWAVDFHAGRITRLHDDVDLAVWLDDVPRIVELLVGTGGPRSDPDEDGGTGYERDGIRLELTYLVRRDDGRVVIPLRDREAMWREGAFGNDCRELEGVRARARRPRRPCERQVVTARRPVTTRSRTERDLRAVAARDY